MIILAAILVPLLGLVVLRVGIAHRNGRHNRALAAAAEACRGEDGLLHGQARAGLGELRFGYYSVGRSGCGAIAAANVLAYLGRPLPLPRVIAACEWGTPCLGARVGLNPLAILPILAVLCRRVGLRVKLSGHVTAPAAIPPGGALLLTHLNGRGLRDGAHTVMLYPDADGRVAVANTYNNSASPTRYASPDAYLRGRRLLLAICVTPKKTAV